MNATKKAYLQLHTAVLLFGLTGILGDLIELPKTTLTWWRMGLATLGLLVIPGLLPKLRAIPTRARWQMVGIGGIIAAHWVTFFGGIALTNVSVALACMATASFFTAILEPIILPRKVRWFELALGIFVVPGIILIQNSTDFGLWGVVVSLISAFLAATFSVLNKKLVTGYDSTATTVLELGAGFLILTILLPVFYYFQPDGAFLPSTMDFLWLVILALACTSFAFVISLAALRELSSFTVNLSINLEPIYTIVLAFVLFHEHKEVSWPFYLGAGMIILAVGCYPILNRRFG